MTTIAAAAAYNTATPISPDEVFYRRVRLEETKLEPSTGKRRLSSNAFGDRTLEPSVDRGLVLRFQELTEEFTREKPENGVARILASQVQGQSVSKTSTSYKAILHAAPVVNQPDERDNPAHCLIKITPISDEHRWAFRKLTERLSQLAEMHLPPPEPVIR